MKDNLERGSRLIFWLKVDFILLSLMSIFAISFLQFFGFADRFDPEMIMALDIIGITLILLFLCVGLLLVITLILTFIFWIQWHYRAIQNANQFSKTIFSPALSVLLSLIPGLGVIFQFFILNDLVRKTESWLQRQKARYNKVKPSLINSWFILVLLSMVSNHLGSDVFIVVISLTALAVYITIISNYCKHETIVHQMVREEEIRKQVEAVLEQREKETQLNE